MCCSAPRIWPAAAVLVLAVMPVHAQQGTPSHNLLHHYPSSTLSPPNPGPGPSTRVRTQRILPEPPEASSRQTDAEGYFVQVSSQRTEEEARSSFGLLQGKYPRVLGSYQPVIRQAEIGGHSTFHRVGVGPFANAREADEVCTRLKAAGGSCIVTRWP